MIPIEYAEDGKIRLPDNIVKMMQNYRHWRRMEKADQVNHIVVDFLKGALITQAQKES